MELELRNAMEEYVLSGIGSHLQDMDVCQCDACRLDIVAIVLNNMTPKYYVSRRGEIYAKLSFLEAQNEVDLISEIAKAVRIVNAFPRHYEYGQED